MPLVAPQILVIAAPSLAGWSWDLQFQALAAAAFDAVVPLAAVAETCLPACPGNLESQDSSGHLPVADAARGSFPAYPAYLVRTFPYYHADPFVPAVVG